MVEIKRLDVDLFQSKYLMYRDDGPLNPKAVTRKYSVFNRYNSSLIGYVKWHAPWRAYCFYALNSVFDTACMREIAQFMEETTRAFKERSLDAAQRKAAKTRRINKLDRLTTARSNAIMDSVVENKEID